MCIIVLDNRSGTERIERPVLKRCENRNPDGMGIMWSDGETLHTFKALKDFNAIWDRYTTARDNGYPVAVHFRKNTEGLTNLDNCHPFEIYEGDFAFMHNGTVTSIKSVCEDGESDTARLCKIFKKLPGDFLRDPVLYDMVRDYVRGDRLLFMDARGNIAMINPKTGRWEEGSRDEGGVWFSHTRDRRYFIDGVDYTKNNHNASVRTRGARDWNNERPGKKFGRLEVAQDIEHLSDEGRLIFIYGDMRDDLAPNLIIPQMRARYAGIGYVQRARLVAVCPQDEKMIPVMNTSHNFQSSVHGIVLATLYCDISKAVGEIYDLLPEGFYRKANVAINVKGKRLRAHTFTVEPKVLTEHSTVDIPNGDWKEWLTECNLLEWQLGVYDTEDDDFEEEDDRDPEVDNVIDLVDRMAAKGHITDPYTDNIQCPSKKCESFDTYPYEQSPDDESFGTSVSMIWCQSCQRSFPLIAFDAEEIN